MGTNAINNNLINDLSLLNVDIPKNSDGGEGFQKSFEMASKSSDLEMLASRKVDAVSELNTSDSVKDNYLKETSNGKSVNKVNSENNSESSNVDKTNKETVKDLKESDLEDDSIENIENAYSNLINEFANILDVTPEEIENYLNENNIDISMLGGNNEILENMIVEFSNIESTVDILTDSDAYNQLVELQNVVSNVQEDLNSKGLSFNDMSKYLDQMNLTEIENVNEFNPVDTVTVNQTQQKDDSKKENNESLNSENRSVNVGNFDNQPTEVQNTTEIANETIHYTENPQEIYDQIGEYIRNLSTENLQEIEMKLQPETLGTIQVKVSQSEGAVKAEFVTNNESVKVMLEGQLIQLKEDFERSGFRVDEVEVRVSTNSFNESAENDSRDDANEAAQRMNTPRRINLNGLDALDELEEMDEEERVVAEMMTANGNSLDYKA